MSKDLGKCKYGPEPATVAVTPAAGGPVINVCTTHARLARKAVKSAQKKAVVVKPEGGFQPGKKGVNPFAKT